MNIDVCSSALLQNPLEILLDVQGRILCENYSNTNSNARHFSFFKETSFASKSIISISKNIRSLNSQKENQAKDSVLFSPSFQCYTTLFFYGALLLELKMLVKRIDQRSPTDREVVWRQLCCIVGIEKVTSEYFSPILQSTLEQKRMNLLEIEILYISFLLTLKEFPSILDVSFTMIEL